ncbi:glycoside hydrolase family 3 [Patescibacteria group bacterium]|nr:glycoside hydrolase family 3 [Patescibacteria group bacterium]
MKQFLFLILFILFTTPTISNAAVAPNPTLTDKIDQMIMIGFTGTTITKGSDIETILKTSNIGGVLLFDYNSQTKTYGKNITTKAQLAALNKSLQTKARTPLFIAIDEEGGQVSRLKRLPGFVPLKSATALGTTTTKNVLAQNTALAKTLKSLGVTVNFAPVLDLTSTNKNAPLTKQQRTFSQNPAVVASYASAIITGMNSSSIISVGKHYPGIGEATIDTHKGLATISTHTDAALLPYKLLVAQQILPAVMVGHVLDKTVDPLLPASLSPLHINILRNTIGFTGVVFTDDLDMGAITDSRSTGEAVVAAVQAGVDVVVISNNITTYNPQAFFDARNALLAAVKNKQLTEARINESYARIMKLKTPLLPTKQ